MDVMTDNWTFGNRALFALNDLWSNIQKSGSLYTEHMYKMYTCNSNQKVTNNRNLH